ncbi:hypothetical protein K435DRAFT_409380 [Dendrothele bispora CBS 962.96]|uniref:Vps72/YL1 C-terminal domain-containing protein n=1 Tax=Dendrothele bispora (strain CBS 962.96) TaxID=1314807 RepID=A0A4S8MF12_DENBC|nr:hypothetical protein K435DRAFT_409380 [Dendrothele bispora CBS 962.96]
MALEEQTKDVDDDNDFVVEKFEEDAFESDFESTDEEATQGDAEGGEREVQDSEKRERKAAKTRLERATAAAHERQKVTFDPTAYAASPSASKPKKGKPKRRVSLGLTINAETGEVMAVQNEDGETGTGPTRKSKRGSTRLNTTETVKRMLESEEKKAQAPKKAKTSTRALTQGELIARALDNEEGNIVEHRDYLLLEEEKRKRARVVRQSVTGPLIRWVSRTEETKVEVVPPSQPQTPSRTQAQANPYSIGYASQLASMYHATQTQGQAGAGVGVTPYGQYGYPYYNYQVALPSVTSATASNSVLPSPAQSTTTAPATQTSGPSISTAPVSSTPATSAAQTTQTTPPAQTLKPSTSTSTPPPTTVTSTPASASAESSMSTATHTLSTSDSTTQIQAQTQTPIPTSTPQNPYLAYSHTSELLASLQQQQASQQGASSAQSTSAQVQLPPHLQHLQHLVPQIQQFYSQLQAQAQSQPSQPQSSSEVENVPVTKTEKVTKNYVIHEVGQYDDVPKPGWRDTMEAMFSNYRLVGEEGEEVNWEKMKVWSGKVRPLARPTLTCPITGLPAKYMDPRTGVPFADVRAFKVLTGLLRHEYAWEEDLECFVGEDRSQNNEGMDVDAQQ